MLKRIAVLMAVLALLCLAAPAAQAQNYYIPGEFGQAIGNLHMYANAPFANLSRNICESYAGTGNRAEMSQCFGYQTDSAGNITGYLKPAWQYHEEQYGAGFIPPTYGMWGPTALSQTGRMMPQYVGYGQQYGGYQQMPYGGGGYYPQQYGYGGYQQYGGYNNMYRRSYGYGQMPYGQMGGGAYASPFVEGPGILGGAGSLGYYPPFYESPSLGIPGNGKTIGTIVGGLGAFALTRNKSAATRERATALGALGGLVAGAIYDHKADQRKRREIEAEYAQRLEQQQMRMRQMEQEMRQMPPAGEPSAASHRPSPQIWINRTGHKICVQNQGGPVWTIEDYDRSPNHSAVRVADASPDPSLGTSCEVLGGGGCSCSFRYKFNDPNNGLPVFDVLCRR